MGSGPAWAGESILNHNLVFVDYQIFHQVLSSLPSLHPPFGVPHQALQVRLNR